MLNLKILLEICKGDGYIMYIEKEHIIEELNELKNNCETINKDFKKLYLI